MIVQLSIQMLETLARVWGQNTPRKNIAQFLVLFGHNNAPAAQEFFSWVEETAQARLIVRDPSSTDYALEFATEEAAVEFLLRWG